MTDEQARIADPISYYDEYGEDEWHRLEETLAGQLEFDATVSHLEERLPGNGHVLDAGGGAGRYTAWLVERGYEVTLLDASAEQLRIARRKVDAADADGNYRRIRGSVHALPFEADRFDATICLGGPLSHLTAEQRRQDAAAELARVTAAGGPALVSTMGRLHVLLKLLQTGRKLDILPGLARNGTYDRELLERHDRTSKFVATHFFRADELRRLLEAGGLVVDRVVGLEGIASLASETDALDSIDESEAANVRSVVEQLRDDAAAADLSSHLLAICGSER